MQEPPVCLSVCLPLCLSVYLPFACLSITLPVCLFPWFYACLPLSLPVCLSVSLLVFLSVPLYAPHSSVCDNPATFTQPVQGGNVAAILLHQTEWRGHCWAAFKSTVEVVTELHQLDRSVMN